MMKHGSSIDRQATGGDTVPRGRVGPEEAICRGPSESESRDLGNAQELNLALPGGYQNGGGGPCVAAFM